MSLQTDNCSLRRAFPSHASIPSLKDVLASWRILQASWEELQKSARESGDPMRIARTERGIKTTQHEITRLEKRLAELSPAEPTYANAACHVDQIMVAAAGPSGVGPIAP